jgi:4'-phosphopantetheinyl transferase
MTTFHLASDEVHTWCASLDIPSETSARLYATLTPDERQRSARFHFDRDRQRFIAARGVLRELLGGYLQIDPRDVSFVYNAFGKPDLSPGFGGELKFNLSHAAGLALIAIATASSIGVDLEYIRMQADYPEIARRFFSAAEVDSLSALQSDTYAAAFLNCWTKKEAYVKARGAGLTMPLNDSDSAARWSLYTFQPAPGYAGAVAIEGSGWRLRHWQWKIRAR